MRKDTSNSRKPVTGRGRASRIAIALGSLVALLALAASPAAAKKTHLLEGTFGSAAQPSFEAANALAVDQPTGDLFVVDSSAKTLSRFHSDGTPANFSALGTNVIDGKGAGDLTPQNGFTFGPSGEQQIAIDNSGTATDGDIYLSQGLPEGGNLVDIFAASGEYLGQLTRAGASGPLFGTTPGLPFSPLGVTVDSAGNVYLGGGYDNKIYKFDPAANPVVNADFITAFTPVDEPIGNVAAGMGPSAGTLFANTFVTGEGESVLKLDSASGALKGVVDAGEDRLLSVDPATGHLYAVGGTITGTGSLSNLVVKEFDASGSTLILSFPVSTRTGIAIDGASGRIYISRGEIILVYGPLVTVPDVTTGPTTITGITSATVKGTVDPDGVALEECFFEYGLTNAYGQTKPCTESVGEIGVGKKEVDADLSGLSQETLYHYRLVAKNANATIKGEDATFKTPSKPGIKGVWAQEVGFVEATLKAQINPENAATTYRFEWGTDPSYGQSTGEIALGSDNTDHTVSLALEGLQPGATYHYRVVAHNTIGISESTDHAFTAFPAPASKPGCANANFRSGPSGALPDCRAFEMVSPVQKGNADIRAPLYDCCFVAGLDQAANDGNAFSFSTEKSFGDAVSAPFASQYLASRTEGVGWSTHGISPPREGLTFPEQINFKYDLEYKAFSPDLSSGWLVHDTGPVLDPCAVAGFSNLYRRDANGSYEALTTAEPMNQTPKEYWPALQGLSADGAIAVFAANGKLTANASGAVDGEGPIIQIYEHVRDPSGEGCGELRLISVLPSGSASAASSSVGKGAGSLGASRAATVENAVSTDGSRIYWSSGVSSGVSLYLHDDAQPKTILVASGSTQFWTASADGSRAIYEVGEELFEYDAESKTHILIAAGSEGVAGASRDATRIYFVSKEALGGEGQAGAPNLYLREGTGAGATRKLVAADTRGDFRSAPLSVVNPEPYKRGVRVTPDGSSIVFSSSKSFGGYDNKSVEDGLPSIELYRYEAGTGQLACISCNPSGGRPQTREVKGATPGLPRIAAQMPAWENQSFAPRVLSDDGNRLFFDSFDALVPRDTNSAEDVYEWERAGGSAECEAKGADLYVASSGGCLSLISTGQSPSDSEVIDASPSGADAFIKTASSLLPQDPGLVDIYDAREGGGLPPPPGPPAGCEGEACQGPPAPPNDPTPASAAFNGAGNVREGTPSKRCLKGKVRREGRCVAKKKAKHHKSKSAKSKKAKHQGRAGR